ncbi:MAG: hypothetical protein Q4B17_03610 [Lautropia sp.]|nr:hypothetical protein [Lautropia sp.]
MLNIPVLKRFPQLPGSHQMMPLLLGGLFLAAGALVGLVVATGNLILIALALGGIAGVLLLNALPVAVWIMLIGVLLINGPVGFFSPGLAKISWLFSLLGIFMAGAAVLYSAVGTRHFQRPMPFFIYTALAFVVLAVISSSFSDGPLSEIAAGAKRHFHFWGVMFLLAVVPFSERHVRGWMLFLVGVALAQLPFTLYQRVVLVPTVLSYDRPGFVPFDIIVGTFEGSLTGGGASAIMAMFQVLVLFGVFIAWREKLLNGFWTLLLSVAIVLPLGLGETKVVLALVPVALFAAYFELVARRPLAFLGMVVATIVIGGILGYFYFLVQVSGDIAEMSLADNIRDTIEYNFGNRGYYATGVNRFTAIPYWFESQSWNNPLKVLFGTGVGSAYGIDGLVPDPGHMFIAHPGMHIDLLTASAILWEFGFVGLLLYFGMIFGAMVALARCFREVSTAWDRVLCRMLMASLAVTLVMALYANSAVVLVSHSFLMYMTLGLVAWRYRHGPLSPTAADLRAAGASTPGVKPGGPASKWINQPVNFPMEGVLPASQLAASQAARRLGFAAGQGETGTANSAQSDAPPHQPPVSSARATMAAAGQSARSAFPKGDMPGGARGGAGVTRSASASARHAAASGQAEAAAASPVAHPGGETSPAAPVPGLAATAQGASPEQQPRSAFPGGTDWASARGNRQSGSATSPAAARPADREGEPRPAFPASPPPSASRPGGEPRSAFPGGNVAQSATGARTGVREPRIAPDDDGIRPMFADDELADDGMSTDPRRSGRQEPRIR